MIKDNPDDNPLIRRLNEEAAARLFKELQQAESGAAGGDELPQIPNYSITGRLGNGGSGEVFVGVRTGSDLRIAVKLFRRRASLREGNRRAWQELDLLAQLHMPGIPQILDYGVHEGRLFIVTSLIDGLPVDDFCRKAGLDVSARINLLARIADVVHTLHERGIVHRDLKPSNILVDSNGDPVIIDLGIASLIEGNAMESFTIEGQPIGSPAYMAPEQARGEVSSVSSRSDVYSLGATGFMLLTGEVPFDVHAPLHEAVRRIAQDSPRGVREIDPAIPPLVGAVLDKAVRALPDDRYETAASFAEDLRRAARGEPVSAETACGIWTRLRQSVRRRRWVALAAALTVMVLLSALGGILIPSRDGRSAPVILGDISPPRGIQLHEVYPHSRLGAAIAIGDVTGDGIEDLVLGAPGRPGSLSSPHLQLAGAIYVVPGGQSPAVTSLDDPRVLTLQGEYDNAGLGERIIIAGDVNADKVTDLAVSAFVEVGEWSAFRRTVYILLGGPSFARGGKLTVSQSPHGCVTVQQPQRGDRFGWAIAPVGDVNKDQIDDIAIGAPQSEWNAKKDTGAAYVLFGSRNVSDRSEIDCGELSPADGVAIHTVVEDGRFGYAIAAIRHGQSGESQLLAIGAPGLAAGRVVLISTESFEGATGNTVMLEELGPESVSTILGVETDDGAGSSLASIGDVNADGPEDLLIGAPQIARLNADAGAAYVVFGQRVPAAGRTLHLADLDGVSGFALHGVPVKLQGAGDLLGQLVSGARDFNGDGISDFAVSAPRANPGGNDSGAAFLVFGRTGLGRSGTLSPANLDWPSGLALLGADNGDSAGSGIAAGDFNGDGLTDLAIGAPFHDRNATDTGAVYVVFGHR